MTKNRGARTAFHRSFGGDGSRNFGALAHFSTIRIVLIALFLNRYFVQGLTRGLH